MGYAPEIGISIDKEILNRFSDKSKNKVNPRGFLFIYIMHKLIDSFACKLSRSYDSHSSSVHKCTRTFRTSAPNDHGVECVS